MVQDGYKMCRSGQCLRIFKFYNMDNYMAMVHNKTKLNPPRSSFKSRWHAALKFGPTSLTIVKLPAIPLLPMVFAAKYEFWS